MQDYPDLKCTFVDAVLGAAERESVGVMELLELVEVPAICKLPADCCSSSQNRSK